ncbi:MAG: response regulator [Prochloraceae cyanobacterium]
MNQTKDLANETLNQQLIKLQQEQFTGKLEVKSAGGNLQWTIYMGLGRLIWADGGNHPNRSWQRLLDRYFPDLEVKEADIHRAEEYECSNYYYLTMLLQHDIITQESLVTLIKTKINEVLFEIVQTSNQQNLEYKIFNGSGDSLFASGLKMSLGLIDAPQALQQTNKAWSAWCDKGLTKISPNLAPNLQEKEKLQQKVSKVIYQNFTQLIDGKKTLKDLAVQMNQEVMKLTLSLLPYIRQGFIQLQEIPDIPKQSNLNNSSTSQAARSTPTNNSGSDRPPLIACIDDSPQICKVMQQIIQKQGYRFISIQQALQAVPTLIAANPDFIFLDIGMPVVNGYEICTQLRRVSKFKNIPIVILTGNDGIVDRVKAKMVGASAFLSKPLDVEKILGAIENLLLHPTDSSNS